MAKVTHKPATASAVHGALWPNDDLVQAKSPQLAIAMPVHQPGVPPRPGSSHRDGMSVDLQWHFHDMHKLLYAFEGAAEVESIRGRNVIPKQLAAWVPAGVPHCTSIHGIRWVSVFFNAEMVIDSEQRVRTVMVSPLMREMLREAMRWPLGEPDNALRTSFFTTMSQLCSEWITREADLVLPTSSDPRVERALAYTSQRMDLKIAEICVHAGISERSLRRHLKAETGITWEVYRQRSRLLQAISLLSDSDEPISEIARQCGFDSPSAFAKVFRDTMGEAPREYRQRTRDAAVNNNGDPDAT